MIGWEGSKSRRVGAHRAAIGSPVGGPGGVRGGVKGGGDSRDGSEREEGARSWEPRGMEAVATSPAAIRRFLWTYSPADADGEFRRGAVWGAGRTLGPEKPIAWSGLVLPPPLLMRDGEVQRPLLQARSGLARGSPSVVLLKLPGLRRRGRPLPTAGGASPLGTQDSEAFKFLGSLWGC